MTKEEIYTQREIGKQLFLVDILHHENDRVRKGGHSSISRDSLAACASMTKEEVGFLYSLMRTGLTSIKLWWAFSRKSSRLRA